MNTGENLSTVREGKVCGSNPLMADVAATVLKVLQHRLFEEIGFKEMNEQLLHLSYSSLLGYITKVIGYVQDRREWNDSFVKKAEREELDSFLKDLNVLHERIYAAAIGSPQKDYQMTTHNETPPENGENADLLEVIAFLIEKLLSVGQFSEVTDKTTITFPFKVPLVTAVKAFCGFEPVNNDVRDRLAKYNIEFSVWKGLLEITLSDVSDVCDNKACVIDPKLHKPYAEPLYSLIYELLWSCPDVFMVNGRNGFYEALRCKPGNLEMYYAPIEVPVPKDSGYGFSEGTPNTERLKVCAFKTAGQSTITRCLYGETTRLVYAVVTAEPGQLVKAIVLVDCDVFKKAFSYFSRVTQVRDLAILIDSSVGGYTWVHSWSLKQFNRGHVSGTAYPDEDVPKILAMRLYDALHKE